MAVNVERATPNITPIKTVILTSTAGAGTIEVKRQVVTSNLVFDVKRVGLGGEKRFGGFLGAFRRQDIKAFAEALLELVK